MKTYKVAQENVRVWELGDSLFTTPQLIIAFCDAALEWIMRVAIIGALIKFIFGGVL